jgi:hypothetical protein
MVDPNPGMGASRKLNEWWITGEGSDWKASPTPYRTLRSRLLQHMSIEKASGLAAEYFHAALGYWPGSKQHHREHGGK